MRQKRSSPCRRLASVLIWQICWILWWSPAILRAQDPKEATGKPDEKVTYMIENPLLREFFANQLVDGRISQQSLPGQEFVDRYVDLQIESFARKVDQELKELVTTTDSLDRLRTRWVAATEGPARKEAAVAMAVMLRGLAKQADSLADLLQAVFPDLQRNKKLDMTIEKKDEADGYLRQMTFIDAQVSKAEQLIRDYLFRPAQTIGVNDLSSENMLMRLDWVEALAKRVADRIL